MTPGASRRSSTPIGGLTDLGKITAGEAEPTDSPKGSAIVYAA